MFSKQHQPTSESIFVKVFAKRKQEYSENSKFNIGTIQKKLADPLQLVLRFTFLLSLLLPVVLTARINATKRFLNELSLRIAQSVDSYLHNRQLII